MYLTRHLLPHVQSFSRLATVVAASASGLGVASAILNALDLPTSDVRILEMSSSVGASFRAWPPATRFISPSFYSNPFNQMDLNSIGAVGDNGVQAYLKANGKDVLDAQHPTGKVRWDEERTASGERGANIIA